MMFRRFVTTLGFPLHLLGLAAICSALPGCGGSGPLRVEVSGTITLNGKPVPKGQIAFDDAAGVLAACGGEIKEGKYSFMSTLGEKKVSITSMQAVSGEQGKYGGIRGDPVSDDNPATVYEEAIPARYNSKTKLSVEVTGHDKDGFPFDLEGP